MGTELWDGDTTMGQGHSHGMGTQPLNRDTKQPQPKGQLLGGNMGRGGTRAQGGERRLTGWLKGFGSEGLM